MLSTPSYVLITGASSGIGLALAKRFWKEKYSLIMVADQQEKLLSAAKDVEMMSGKAEGQLIITICKDLSDQAQVESLVSEIHTQNISVSILVNNAGIGLPGRFTERPLEDHLKLFRLNDMCMITLTYLLLADLEKNKGKILNVGSMAAFMPGSFFATYHASKALMVNFSLGLHDELKSKGVSVTVLCPGPTLTNFQKKESMENTLMFSHALTMSAETVANDGYVALMLGKKLEVPGINNKIFTFLFRLMPIGVIAKISRVLMSRKP